MKILAVIPARSGSRDIPNKNIRIIGGHPLVYYSIKNAMASKMITNIIVTTDSPEIQIIAKQMGVDLHKRSAELCGDAVTLDEVVCDAVPHETDWDYIVTLQPTSPTLTHATLDSAIRYAVDGRYDTVVSVVNSPQLSWNKKNGLVKPSYERRQNHQFLPPCYVETGAFVISKGSLEKSGSRFGKNISVYEIPFEETVTIKSFYDLKIAESIIKKDKVAIYVNGNNKRGIGHIYRALEMADEFFVKPDIYYDSNQTRPEVFGKTFHKIVPVNGIAELFDRCREEQYTIFINDILSTSIDYMIGLKTVLPEARIINFEDDGEGAVKADLVFNALFQDETIPQMKTGEKYYISGKTFMFYEPIEIKEKVSRIFISFGGADPQNYSDRLLSLISKPEYGDYQFLIVLGRAKYNVPELMEYNKFPNIEVFHDVSNMPELMSRCDIAVTSRGRTGYELAMLGLPTIAMAQNKREEKHGFVCNENGFTYIGLNPSDRMIEGTLKMYLALSKEERRSFQEKMLSHDLRSGRQRVIHLINSL